MAVFSVAVPRYPVLGSEFAHGDADQEAAVADEGEPGRSAPHLETAAGQDAEELLLFLLVIRFLTSLVVLFFLFPREFPRGCREARNLVVARLAVETVQMPAKHPDSPVDAERAIPSVAVVRRLEVESAADSLERIVRNPPGVHVDDAADRA